MYVLEGVYEKKAFWKLKIASSNDGPEDGKSFKKLKGVGEVKIIGSRPTPYSPIKANHGEIWIGLKRKVHHIQIENFQVGRVATGITASEGGYHHLEFRDLKFEDTRQNVVLGGKDSKQISMERISGIRYSKRHIRLGQGISEVLVTDSHADAQFLQGDFAVGFDVENPAWNIEFRNCSSRGNVFVESKYWNGDGFKAEEETKNIRWIRCQAFDNADAGFDIKTKNAYLEDIVAERNSRNIRIWQSAVLKKIQASSSKIHGGETSEAGIWSEGPYDCYFCQIENNGIQINAESSGKSYRIRFFDSVIRLGKSQAGELVRKEDRIKIDWIRTKLG